MCCGNGCGTVCVDALKPLQNRLKIRPLPGSSPLIHNNHPISRPIQPSVQSRLTEKKTIAKKLGYCPQIAHGVTSRRCVAECVSDEECAGVLKCCNNGCARICLPPEKAGSGLRIFLSEKIISQK